MRPCVLWDDAAVDLTTVYRLAAQLTLQKSLLLYIQLPSPLKQMEKRGTNV